MCGTLLQTYSVWKRDRNLCWGALGLLAALFLRYTVRLAAVAV